jgi:hypothetical protein
MNPSNPLLQKPNPLDQTSLLVVGDCLAAKPISTACPALRGTPNNGIERGLNAIIIYCPELRTSGQQYFYNLYILRIAWANATLR